MDSAGGEDHIERFVSRLVWPGSALAGLVADLIDKLPTQPYPGEKPAAVAVGTLYGAIRTAPVADPRDMRRPTELIDLAATRTADHPQIARDLSRRSPRDAGDIGPTYG